MLQASLRGAVKWVTAHLASFGLDYSTSDDARLRAFSELSVALYQLERRRNSTLIGLGVDEDLDTWHSFVFQHCQRAEYIEMVRKFPTQASSLLLPYFILRALGHKISAHEKFLHAPNIKELLLFPEVLPFRELDRLYFLRQSGLFQRNQDQSELYKNTLLSRASGLVYLSDQDVYHITHSIFYLTDFGLSSFPFGFAETKRVGLLVQGLILHYCRRKHWDILGELLINAVGLGLRGDEIYSASARRFLESGRRGAFMPGPALSPRRRVAAKISPSAARKRYFATHYHTTLVSIIFSVAALS